MAVVACGLAVASPSNGASPEGTPAPAASPGTAPSPTPAPKRHSFLGQGAIIFTGTGNYDLGARGNARNGEGVDQSTYQTNLTAGLERRTEQTAFSITEGLGYGEGLTSYGQLQAAYRTPGYELDYGAVAGGGETQLQIGGFTRGIRFVKPRPRGTLEFIAAAAFQQDNTGYRALGARRTYLSKRAKLALTLFDEHAIKGDSHNAIADVSWTRYGQTGSATAEIAAAHPYGVALANDGTQLAFGVAATRAGKSGFASFTAQFEPSGFASLNSVVLPGMTADFLIRHDLFHNSSLSLDLGTDRTDSAGIEDTDKRATATFTTSIRKVTVTVLENYANSTGTTSATIDHSTGVILGETLFNTQFSESLQRTSTSGSSGDAFQNQIAFAESRQLLGGYVALTQSRGNSFSGGSAGKYSDNEYAYTKTIGRKKNLDLTLGYGQTLQTTIGIATPTETTTVALTRRLSKVVSVRGSVSRIHQGGPTPGDSNAFAVDLVGPFNVGSAQTLGRINPNLPATIKGRVFAVSSSQFYGAQAQQSGYGNVLIVLDGVQTQRTDSSGDYEFGFVKPGTHTVSIEPSSLGAGLVADHQLQTFKIQGGQVQEINFGVGNFSGVTGQLYTTINGERHGIGDVTVVVDDLLRTVTDANGQFGIGGLTQGAHRVSIDISTLPSNAELTGGKSFSEKTVQCVNGSITRVDFTAERLGSVSGTVLYAPDNGFGDLRGAKDVYVVANPGDHAAITDPDGGFIIDNLPAGKYTLSLDEDTLPAGESVVQGPDGDVYVPPEGKIDGIQFKLGSEPKEVVYTFNGAKKTTLQIATDLIKAPPGALVHVTVTGAPKGATGVKLDTDNFGSHELKRAGEAWVGSIVVPLTLGKGDYAISASAEGASATGDAVVTVDPKIPLVLVHISPQHPSPGHSIRVVARIDAPVAEGDQVNFPDGYTVKLPKPNGRVFAFDMRIWTHGLPYNGSIITKDKLVFPFYLK
jgi:hypothetical protein